MGVNNAGYLTGDVTENNLLSPAGADFTADTGALRQYMLQKRFDLSFVACEDLARLVILIEQSLREPAGKNRYQSGDDYLLYLRDEVHPGFFDEYIAIRAKMELTNDLLASYALIHTRLINFDTIREICEKQNLSSQGEIIYVYRHIWAYITFLMNTLFRISTSDLRFWSTTRPYVRQAEKCAAIELKLVKTFFVNGSRSKYGFLLEDPDNIEHFWRGSFDRFNNTYPAVESSTPAQRAENRE